MAAAAASSSSKRRRSYDVFLSFRGKDVRNNFLGHLYTALDQRGINTYMDSEELRKGEQISPALMEAIEESRIAIVVFSKNYALSKWCLDELAKIMECKEQRDLIVFPVFYKVEPCEVRTPRKSYLEAMAKHEDKLGKDSEKVRRWKEALFGAGSLSGQHFTDGYEPKFIQDIAQEISTQLDRTPLYVAKYPTGIDSRVQDLKAILNLQSNDDALMIGLWGQGGVGKTTLAKAIYNAVFREFQGSCCLERVRENSNNSKDLGPLQEKLLSQMLPGKRLTVHSDGRGSQLIQDRLCNKKVLIILDDVDDQRQLNALVGNSKWFGQGSRIIITTRNRHLLTSHGVDWDHIYEVKALEHGEDLELLRKHAFLANRKIEISSNLIDRVLCYARGLPLALEVLGSFLCGRGEHEWKSTLQKLSKSPDKRIHDVLKVSYDGLDDDVKEIFLDIACFFKGQKTEYIEKVLDSCHFGTTIGVKILIERSLIRKEHGALQMHDLIQMMGMDIVKEECRGDPGKQSRLWLYDDVLDVLSGHLGTNAIKAIVLKLPQPAEMYIGHDYFAKMKRLRLLILRNVRNPFTGPIHLSNELRWLEWPHCASIPEFSNGSKKLVGIDLQSSKIEVGLEQFKDFNKLKFVNLSGCQSLVCMPNLNYTPNLEELDLSGCENLEDAHESVANHSKLQQLNLSGCSKLLHLPSVIHCENLRRLVLADCLKLQRFPIILNTKRLRELDLRRTSIKDVPASIENLVSLKEMDLRYCQKLSILPSSIYWLGNLATLRLDWCLKLIKFPKKEEDSRDHHLKTGLPKLRRLELQRCNLSEADFLENPSCFPSLSSLDLRGNNFTSLPSCRHLNKLESLRLERCNQLQEILGIPEQLSSLHADGCASLSKIPFDIGQVDVINLSSCHELVSNGSTIYDLFKLEHALPGNRCIKVTLPGGEMPEWLLPNSDGHISFVASKDLLKKFLGLAFCVVYRAKEGTGGFSFQLNSSINSSKWMNSGYSCSISNSDHVSLHYATSRFLWQQVDAFVPNDSICFQFTIRASAHGIVKKCGFRLLCKPLENDLEDFLQQNQLLHPALLYEVRHEESQTSTEEGSSSKLVHTKSNMADFSIEKLRYSLIHPDYRNVRPGGDMPEEFVLVEDGTMSFMASQNLYDKFLGLALCVIFGVENGKKEVSFDIVPYVNGQRQNGLSGALGSFDSDHMWIQYVKSNVLWGLLEGGVDFCQFDKKYVLFSLQLEVSGGTMKKLGCVIRCRQLEDDLKIVLKDNQSVNLASLCEDSYSPVDSWLQVQPGSRHRLPREYLRKCHMHIEELEANDSKTDETRSGECSSETD